MWLFTPFGFFSIVAHNADRDTLIVRSRVFDDLVAFRAHLPFPSEIVPSDLADYPYRIQVARADVASMMDAWIRNDLRYPNFKNEAPRPVYSKIWRLLVEAFRSERPIRDPATPEARRRHIRIEYRNARQCLAQARASSDSEERIWLAVRVAEKRETIARVRFALRYGVMLPGDAQRLGPLPVMHLYPCECCGEPTLFHAYGTPRTLARTSGRTLPYCSERCSDHAAWDRP